MRTRRMRRADAQGGCTGRMHGADARGGCTARMHGADARRGCTERMHGADARGERALRTRILRNSPTDYFTNRARPGTTCSRSASISPSRRNFATLLAVTDLTTALRMETCAPSLIVTELLGA